MNNENKINRNLGFAFKGNSSENILAKLNWADEKFALSGASSIKRLLEMIGIEKFQLILGLGVYTGRDQDKIRIEQVCTNKFRNDLISINAPEKYQISSFLTSLKNSKYAYRMGNSWCNLVSWKIMTLINKLGLETQYTFLHIPNRMSINDALKEINTMIKVSLN